MWLEIGIVLNSIGKLQMGVFQSLWWTQSTDTCITDSRKSRTNCPPILEKKTLKSRRVPTLLNCMKDFTRGVMVNTKLVGTKTKLSNAFVTLWNEYVLSVWVSFQFHSSIRKLALIYLHLMSGLSADSIIQSHSHDRQYDWWEPYWVHSSSCPSTSPITKQMGTLKQRCSNKLPSFAWTGAVSPPSHWTLTRPDSKTSRQWCRVSMFCPTFLADANLGK